MIKCNKKVTLKTRDTYSYHRKHDKLKTAKKVFQNFSPFFGESDSAKKRKLASHRRIYKSGVSFKMGCNESKIFFLRTSLRFYSALAVLEPRIYLLVEQFGAENISLLSGRLVI